MISLDTLVEKQASWRSLVEGGDTKRLAESVAVACSAMATAIDVLAANLKAIGYPVQPITSPCADGLDERLRRLKAEVDMVVPDALAHVWRFVGGISVLDLESYSHSQFWEDQGVGALHSDGIHLDACTDEWVSLVIEECLEWRAHPQAEAGDYELPISPDALHKENISGDGPYTLSAGAGWAPVIKGFYWSDSEGTRPRSVTRNDSPDLIEYLRTAVLECAGFPGLFGDEDFEPIRVRLLHGVPLF